MANLTITVDAEVLKRARIKALQNEESVNAHLARKLEEYAGEAPQTEVTTRLLRHAAAHPVSSGPAGRTWTRDDLYDR